jgi:AP-3 complex subunit mu
VLIHHALTFCSGRVQRWKRDKALPFVPPDGRFALMEHHYLPSTSRSLSAPSTQVPVPFALESVVTIEEDGGASDHKH